MTRRIPSALLIIITLLAGCATKSGPSTETTPTPTTPGPTTKSQAPPQQIGNSCTADIKANLGLYLNQGAALPVYKDSTLKEVVESIPTGGALLYYQADATTQSLQVEYVGSQTGCWTRGFVKQGEFDKQAHEAHGTTREVKDSALGTKASVQAVQLQAETALFDRSGNLVSSLPAGGWVGVRAGEAWESGASNHNLLLIHAYSPSPEGAIWKVGATKDDFWFVNLIDGKAKPEGYKVKGFGGQ